MGGIEAEEPGFEFGDEFVGVVDAGVALGEGEDVWFCALVVFDNQHFEDATGEVEGLFDGTGDAGAEVGFKGEAVDDDFDSVFFLFFELGPFVEGVDDAVNAGASKAAAHVFAGDVHKLAFFGRDDWGEENHLGAGWEFHDFVDDVFGAAPGDFFMANWAMRHTDAGEKQAQVVVDSALAFGVDGVESEAGFAGAGEAGYGVDVGFVHNAEELAGVGAEGFDVAALAFGVDGVESEAGFAGAGEAGDDNKFVAGDVNVDVFEVMGAGATDFDCPGSKNVAGLGGYGLVFIR